MVTLVITNLTSETLDLSELYAEVGPAGSSNAALTVTRSVAQLDSMPALQKLLADGDVSVVATNSTDNSDLFSVPMEQHGVSAALAVDGVAVVTATVSFAKAFPSGVTPNVKLQVVQGVVTNFKATPYVRALTNTGFTIALDVTTASGTGGATCTVHWQAAY